MHVLVTGAAGLVGNEICNFLLKKNFRVLGVINVRSSLIYHENYSEIKIDLLKGEINVDVNFDAVVHCSAVMPIATSGIENSFFYQNQNLDKTVFDFCIKNNTKLLYFSAAYIYDSGIEHLNELSVLNSNLKGYLKSKLSSEEEIMQSKLNAIIFRLSSPYGNIQNQRNVMRLFVEKARQNSPIILIDQGQRQQNFIHVADIASACYCALSYHKKSIFNLVYNRSYTMLELAKIIKEICNSETELAFDITKTDVYSNVNFDNSKIKKELGWIPELDLRLGLTRMLNL